MIDGPLIDGIPALGPGEERSFNWGQYGGLIKYLGDEVIKATVHYKKNGKTMDPVTCYLDIKSFEGTDDSSSLMFNISKNVENISNDIQKVVSGFSKPQIRIIDLPDFKSKNDK